MKVSEDQMNPKAHASQFEGMTIALQVSFQRDHLRQALERIVAYAEPPEGPVEMSNEELCNAYNALKDIARTALQTVPAFR